MADNCDYGRRQTEFHAAVKIDQIRRAAAQPEANATGRCLYCDQDDMATGQRWCDADCCRAWEREQK